MSKQSRQDMAEAGITVVANIKRDKALIEWARQRGIYQYIGRPMPRQKIAGSKWRNPFKAGTKDEICEQFARHLADSPELMAAIPELRGKVLGCWCHPDKCHGDHLARLANSSTA